jgi:hypothetical protein
MLRWLETRSSAAPGGAGVDPVDGHEDSLGLIDHGVGVDGPLQLGDTFL